MPEVALWAEAFLCHDFSCPAMADLLQAIKNQPIPE